MRRTRLLLPTVLRANDPIDFEHVLSYEGWFGRLIVKM